MKIDKFNLSMFLCFSLQSLHRKLNDIGDSIGQKEKKTVLSSARDLTIKKGIVARIQNGRCVYGASEIDQARRHLCVYVFSSARLY